MMLTNQEVEAEEEEEPEEVEVPEKEMMMIEVKLEAAQEEAIEEPIEEALEEATEEAIEVLEDTEVVIEEVEGVVKDTGKNLEEKEVDSLEVIDAEKILTQSLGNGNTKTKSVQHIPDTKILKSTRAQLLNLMQLKKKLSNYQIRTNIDKIWTDLIRELKNAKEESQKVETERKRFLKVVRLKDNPQLSEKKSLTISIKSRNSEKKGRPSLIRSMRLKKKPLSLTNKNKDLA